MKHDKQADLGRYHRGRSFGCGVSSLRFRVASHGDMVLKKKEKCCKCCGENLPFSEFYQVKDKRYPNRIYFFATCKLCTRDAETLRRQRRKPKVLKVPKNLCPNKNERCPFDASKGKVDVSGFDRFLSRPIPIGDCAP